MALQDQQHLQNYWRTNMKNWIKDRIEERTSWNGAMLVAVGVVVLIAGPFAKLAAYAAIAYGAWTIFKKED